jgi:predicted RNA binding protein YcfA (HicA-like mRNA interferase family)
VTSARLVPYRRLAKVAAAAGFTWVRRDGSHNTFQSSDGRIAVIPDHGSRPIGRGLLHKILRQMDCSDGSSVVRSVLPGLEIHVGVELNQPQPLVAPARLECP